MSVHVLKHLRGLPGVSYGWRSLCKRPEELRWMHLVCLSWLSAAEVLRQRQKERNNREKDAEEEETVTERG